MTPDLPNIVHNVLVVTDAATELPDNVYESTFGVASAERSSRLGNRWGLEIRGPSLPLSRSIVVRRTQDPDAVWKQHVMGDSNDPRKVAQYGKG